MRTISTTLAALALSLAACSGSVSTGSKTVGSEELTKQVSAALEASVGQKPTGLTCPDEIEAKVDATTTCTLPVDGQTYDVDVRITSVADGTAKFDVKVADTPNE